MTYQLHPEKLRRRNQFRTITVSAFPVEGALPSQVLQAAQPQLQAFAATLAPGYTFPLASHGGPLWEPLCYTQIGGLSVATFITLLLVPVLYAIFVLDVKLVPWDTMGSVAPHDTALPGTSMVPTVPES